MLPYLAPPAAETVDSYSFEPKLPAGVKPVGPVEIDWTHPLADKLAYCLLFDGPAIRDLVIDAEVLNTNDNAVVSAGVGSRGKAAIWNAESTSGLIKNTDYQPIRTSSGDGNGDFTAFVLAAPEAHTTGGYLASQRSGSSGFNQWDWVANSSEAPSSSSGWMMFQTYGLGYSNTGAGNLVDGKPHAFLFRRKGTTHELYSDGVAARSKTDTVRTVYKTDQHFGIGGYVGAGGDGGTSTKGPQYLQLGWDRALTDSEVAEISRDPYQFLKQPHTVPRITTPKPELPTYEYTIPDPRWEAPAIMVPGVKPTGPVVIDWDHPLAEGLVCAVLYRDNSIVDLVSGKSFIMVGAPTPEAGDLAFDGVSDAAALVVDLSGTSVVTVATGLDIEAFANDDGLMFEHTSNVNTSSGFNINPNAGSGALDLALSYYSGGASYILARHTRPSAGYHDYVARFARESQGISLMIDGVESVGTFPLNQSGVFGTTFKEAGLNINSRDTLSLRSESKNKYLFLWKRDIWGDEAANVSRDPYQFLIPA